MKRINQLDGVLLWYKSFAGAILLVLAWLLLKSL